GAYPAQLDLRKHSRSGCRCRGARCRLYAGNRAEIGSFMKTGGRAGKFRIRRYAHTGSESIAARPILRLRDGSKVCGLKLNAAERIRTGAELGQDKVTMRGGGVHHPSFACGEVYGRGRYHRVGEQLIYVAFRGVIVGCAPGTSGDEHNDD